MNFAVEVVNLEKYWPLLGQNFNGNRRLGEFFGIWQYSLHDYHSLQRRCMPLGVYSRTFGQRPCFPTNLELFAESSTLHMPVGNQQHLGEQAI